MRKTKLVITLGPALLTKEGPLKEVLDIADAVRINASHSKREQRNEQLTAVRAIIADTGRHIPIFLDLQGPKWRVGAFEAEIDLVPDSQGVLFLDSQTVDTSNASWAIPIPHPELLSGAKTGQTWLLDDGRLRLEITAVSLQRLEAIVRVGGLLKARKGIHPIGLDVAVEPLTNSDIEDVKWGVEQEIDLFAQSFVRSAQDVLALQATIRAFGGKQPIIAKIEHPGALDQLDEILDVSWGVMVARGDLGVELGVEKVPSLQKEIIKRAKLALKPVITATQMLESMIDRPQPTRAEASDIANAIWDGSDAVMLSAESAVGQYPLQAVQWLASIAEDADEHFFHPTGRNSIELPRALSSRLDVAVANAACRIAEDLNARLLMVFTEGGGSARMVSRLAGDFHVVGATTSTVNARIMGLLRGVHALVIPKAQHMSEMLVSVEPILKQEFNLQAGDRVVITLGHPLWTAGTTNTVRVLSY